MAARIFLSHAGPDLARAREVASHLRAEGVEVLLDREATGPGDSFLTFMEEALASADYCLLLWSREAAERAYVRLEWEAALVRSVTEGRGFLLVGRLADHPLPHLLAPRLWVDLFPALRPGIDSLLELWRQDRRAEAVRAKPVGSAPGISDLDPDGARLYLANELFGWTLPLRLGLDAPIAHHLTRVRQAFQLPEKLDYEGRIGMRFEYGLAREGRPLSRRKSLWDEGVREGELLDLTTRVVPFAAIEPTEGQWGGAVSYRSLAGGEDEDELPPWLVAPARTQLLAALRQAGLA